MMHTERRRGRTAAAVTEHVTADMIRVTADMIRVTADMIRVTADMIHVTTHIL